MTARALVLALALALLAAVPVATPAGAAGSGDHMHAGEIRVGKPGKPAEVTRELVVRMFEDGAGGMHYDPGVLTFRKGETVRIVVRNEGETDHEFVLGTPEENEEHRLMMEKFPEMEHDDPNAVRLAPGETGEIVWTFSRNGTFQFACLIPGHMQSGMHGPVTVE